MKIFNYKNLNTIEIVKVLFSLIARVWNMLLVFLLTPIYIKYLGIESYGLIGFFVLMQSLLMALEFGFPLSLNRAIAKLRSKKIDINEISGTLKSFEYLFIFMAIVVLCIVGIPLSIFHNSFINPESLTSSIVSISVFLIILQISLRFPIIIYQAALTGFEKIVDLNILMIFFSTIRMGGSGLALAKFNFDIVSFFTFQVIVVFLELLVTRFYCWNFNNLRKKIDFNFKFIISQKNFIFTAFSISLIGIILSQIDKMIIVSNLPLESFGEYSVMVLYGSAILALGNPIGSVSFPAFSRLSEQSQEDALLNKLGEYIPIASLILLPISLFLIFFSDEVLRFYLEKPLSQEIIKLFPIYLLGAMFAAFIPLFNGLLLSSNYSRDALYILLVNSIIYIPGLFLLIKIFGVYGATYTFCIIQFLIFISFIFRSGFIYGINLVLRKLLYLFLLPLFFIFVTTLSLKEIYLSFFKNSTGTDILFMLVCLVISQLLAFIIYIYRHKFSY